MFSRINAVIVAGSMQLKQSFPGLIACVVVAAAANFLSEHYGAPVMLFALLLGMSMNFLIAQEKPRLGIEVAARQILRVGVALLGLRITLGQIADLGWQPLVLVGICVVATIALSMAVARMMGFQSIFGMLTGGATAICGASAALALAAALPNHPLKERATLFTVIGISVLSTFAMIVYPLLAHAINLDSKATGVFLGATIHDVAQVVGAGYSISRETGDIATVVKLFRISMLLPVILWAVMITRARSKAAQSSTEPSLNGEEKTNRPPLLPMFAVVFVALVVVNSLGWIRPTIQHWGSDLSRWCLLTAIAALGMKTEIKRLVEVGFKPVALMVGETIFLAALALMLLRWGL